MIEIRHLGKAFGRFKAVDDLSFSVAAGEVLGFLGPNGAGKTTTMRMVTGFIAPSSGTVSVCGHDIQSDALRAKRLMGYLPEGAPAYGEMTPQQFIGFVANIRGLRGAAKKRRIDTMVAELALETVLHRPIETLSKGYKRRVGLAQALVHDPQVLVLDEPTDGLDPNQKQQVRDLIQRIAADKIILVVVDCRDRAEIETTLASVFRSGGDHRSCTGRCHKLDRSSSNAATPSLDQRRLTGLEFCDEEEIEKRCEKDLGDATGFDIRQSRRRFHRATGRDHHFLCVSAAGEQRHDPVSRDEVIDVFSDLEDRSGTFEPENF